MKVRNERGYALVLVLVIITITFTLALSMSGMALSARKQFNKTDEVNKATDLAEMGVAHYETLLAGIVLDSNVVADTAVQKKNNGNGNGKKSRNDPDYDSYFYTSLQNALSQAINRNLLKNVEGSNEYKVTLESLSAVQADKTILVKFISEGNTGKEKKVLKSTITIEKNEIARAGETAPEKSNFEIKENNKIEIFGTSFPPHDPYLKSTFFEKSIALRGKNKIIVHGDAYFKDLVELRGTDTFTVHGDAIFYTKVDNPYVNGSSAFCVYGNTYYIENNKLVDYIPFPSGRKDACPRPLDDEWYINPDEGVKVQY